jgi:hypothetical protein
MNFTVTLDSGAYNPEQVKPSDESFLFRNEIFDLD